MWQQLRDSLKDTDPEVFQAIVDETDRQHLGLELIASENFPSQAVLLAMASAFNNKYAEGYPGRRYYGGCEHADRVEELARDRARALFGADHANVQPHAGSQANMAVYFAALEPGDTYLGMDLNHGGHLSHGHKLSFSGQLYKPVLYGLDETEHIDYDAVAELAREHRPKLIVCGASAYSRVIDFARLRAIADEFGALLMADIAHIAGLVVAGVHPSPVPHAHFVTTTTHKTLRGPRGGMVLTTEEWGKAIDRAVFPGLQGGPLVHVIAAKAVAFHEASKPEFKQYQQQVVANARALADELRNRGVRIVSGGTDNHVFLVDLTPLGVTGRDAEDRLGEVRITVNKNAIPFDKLKPMIASGIRVGTPAVTARGMGTDEMRTIGELIHRSLTRHGEAGVADGVRAKVRELVDAYPLYPGFRQALLT